MDAVKDRTWLQGPGGPLSPQIYLTQESLLGKSHIPRLYFEKCWSKHFNTKASLSVTIQKSQVRAKVTTYRWSTLRDASSGKFTTRVIRDR